MSNETIVDSTQLRARKLIISRVFQHAVQQDPCEMVGRLGSPRKIKPRKVADEVISTLPNERIFYDGSNLAIATGFLEAGYRDVTQLVWPMAKRHSKDHALAIVRNPNTVKTIAELALRSTSELYMLLRKKDLHTAIDVDESEEFMAITDEDYMRVFDRTSRHCPFAGKKDLSTGFVEVKPTNLFADFVEHAGTLAVLVSNLPKLSLRERIFK